MKIEIIVKRRDLLHILIPQPLIKEMTLPCLSLAFRGLACF